jgi:hypothetical protein
MNTTAPNIAAADRHRQRALDALANLTTSDLFAIADALDMAAKADARDIAAADARAAQQGRSRHSDGSYMGQHRSTTEKRDRAPHMAAARRAITTAISCTYMADRD